MSIVMRIYTGMGAMIALIILVGGFASFQTNGLANKFSDYRLSADASLASVEIADTLYQAQIALLEYRADADPKHVVMLSQKVAKIAQTEQTLSTFLDGVMIPEGLAQVPIMMVDFETLMKEAATLQEGYDALVQETGMVGLKARQQISEVMETALRDNDTKASSVAGLAASNLLLGRLYL